MKLTNQSDMIAPYASCHIVNSFETNTNIVTRDNY